MSTCQEALHLRPGATCRRIPAPLYRRSAKDIQDANLENPASSFTKERKRSEAIMDAPSQDPPILFRPRARLMGPQSSQPCSVFLSRRQTAKERPGWSRNRNTLKLNAHHHIAHHSTAADQLII
ncbi:hypothetical protein Cob_v004434 [Colletotrichum orbiculare MAFF 240422]|uniref:Uncharacterized protein n=1 Tax=Colletotrichum orbiculare (strain 104-T / ATCC 96160 / CBS 514.97 / LARS 414 / MAFF 240422) TaxID=1213857 RepID=A0A484FYN7_COLOR|nr:hypothetical protein Cob_v004434 [Colletotrichum orbiculare MAFF 240422]